MFHISGLDHCINAEAHVLPTERPQGDIKKSIFFLGKLSSFLREINFD